MSNLTEYPSPDTEYRVVLAAYEMRMSHWVESAALWRSGDSRALLLVGDDMWSADSVHWSEDSVQVTLEMRRYPGDAPGITVILFPTRAEATVQTPKGSETVSFSRLSRYMNDCYNMLRRS